MMKYKNHVYKPNNLLLHPFISLTYCIAHASAQYNPGRIYYDHLTIKIVHNIKLCTTNGRHISCRSWLVQNFERLT